MGCGSGTNNIESCIYRTHKFEKAPQSTKARFSSILLGRKALTIGGIGHQLRTCDLGTNYSRTGSGHVH